VISWILWGERVTARQVVGLCLAVGVVVLCNA
jgi:drug/metabolite transporter (DMT)-like permease